MTNTFTQTLLDWHAVHGRHDLPWQNTQDAYLIWVSEIMLQQTQVSTVIDYYTRFIEAFPNVKALAAAKTDLVLHYWTGLGYYARARNLHKTAQIVQRDYNGHFPKDFESMLALPGIGRSTAGAILAFSEHQPHAILDGNVKRTLARFYEIEGWYGVKDVEKKLWALAEKNTPSKEVARYTQAIMDFGATLCTRNKPKCPSCPLSKDCKARLNNRTQELPHGKPKKQKPVKQTIMLLIVNDRQEVLLEKRPPAGIWGSLWCPPEVTKLEETAHYQELTLKKKETLSSFRHTFSHYHLDITPILLSVKDKSDVITESKDRVWYNLNSPQQLGLAAPVKTLLKQTQTNR